MGLHFPGTSNPHERPLAGNGNPFHLPNYPNLLSQPSKIKFQKAIIANILTFVHFLDHMGCVVKCSKFYCYFNLEMITKYLVELYNLFSALMLPAQGSKRECSVNKI